MCNEPQGVPHKYNNNILKNGESRYDVASLSVFLRHGAKKFWGVSTTLTIKKWKVVHEIENIWIYLFFESSAKLISLRNLIYLKWAVTK